MNAIRWALCGLCLLVALSVAISTGLVIERNRTLNDYVKVRFDPPAGAEVYVDGQRVGRSTYLSSKRSYRIEYRLNGVVVKEGVLQPQQVGNIRCTW